MHQHNPLSVEEERKKESNPVIYTWKNYAGDAKARPPMPPPLPDHDDRSFIQKEEMIPIRLHVHSISGRVFVTDKRITKGRGMGREKKSRRVACDRRPYVTRRNTSTVYLSPSPVTWLVFALCRADQNSIRPCQPIYSQRESHHHPAGVSPLIPSTIFL